MLFHEEKEKCKSKHAHKIGVNAEIAKHKVGDIVKEMAALSKKTVTNEGEVQFRNAAIHSLLTADEAAAKIATCDEVTREVKSAMPAIASPTSLGAAALEPGQNEEMG